MALYLRGLWARVARTGCVLGMLAGLSLGAAETPIRVLIFSGQNNHNWRETTPRLKKILAGCGRFSVDVTEHPEQATAATLAPYQVILNNWNAWKPNDQMVKEWPAPMREAFLDFVRRGGGLVIVHAGSATFPEWTDFQKLIGGTWGQGTGHGKPHAFQVKFVDPTHPITRGLPPFETTDELWHRMATQPGIKVLATAFSAPDSGGSGNDETMALVTEFGQGRCFNLVLGHHVAAMEAAGFQALLRRGAEWAGTGRVTLSPEAALGSLADEAAALKAMCAYHFGDSREALLKVERLVFGASLDPERKARLAAKLAGFLTADATPDAKEVICRQLSLIAGAAEVPALARLLSDTNFSYHARLALERIPDDAADAALRAALANTTGQIRQGIISSLAARRSEAALPALIALLESDAATAGAGLQALSNIRGPKATAALAAAEAKLPAALKTTWAEALTKCAVDLQQQGKNRDAAVLLEKLIASAQPASVRLLAFPLYAVALGDEARQPILRALASEDRTMQLAALDALHAAKRPALLQAAAESFDRLSPELQSQLVVLAGESGDPALLPLATKAAGSADGFVRSAALRALGLLGADATVPVLLGFAAQADNAEKKIIFDSLLRLRGVRVDSVLADALEAADVPTKILLLRVLAGREAKAGIASLIHALSHNDAGVRREAVAGLEHMGDLTACRPLIQAVESGKDTASVVAALGAICAREKQVAPVVNALPKATPAAQSLLLAALGAAGGPQALQTVRDTAKSANPETRVAAIRVLADWADAGPLDDLIALATAPGEAKIKILAARGVAQLAPLAKDRAPEKLVVAIDQLIASGLPPGEQKALVSALGKIPGPASLKTLQAKLNDPALSAEAKAAWEQLQGNKPAAGQKRDKKPAPARAAKMTAALPPPLSGAELQRYGTLVNLCVGATATNLDGLKPDGQGSWAPAAIDRNPSTYWDETNNQKLYVIQVKFKQPSIVAYLRLMGYTHYQYAPRDFEILCDDKPVKKIDDAKYTDNLFSVDLPPTPCSTVTLRITRAHGLSPAIRELEIYGLPKENQQ